MGRNVVKACYIVIVIFTILFAIVEIGLASDLLWEINRRFIGFGGVIRPRTRYLIFCSTWGIIFGLVLLIMAVSDAPWFAHAIGMTISMILWLVAAAMFTSLTGGGISCGSLYPSCFVVNIVNATLAFAWINWAFVFIGLLLSLALGIPESTGQQPNNTAVRTTGEKQPPNTTQHVSQDQGPQMPAPHPNQQPPVV